MSPDQCQFHNSKVEPWILQVLKTPVMMRPNMLDLLMTLIFMHSIE